MKLAVIALIAVVLLGGGGAGAYFFLNKPAEASAAVDEVAKAEHDAKAAAAAEEGAVAAVAQFVPMDVLVLPVIGDHGIVQNISLVISLEVPDEATATEVKNILPRLKDAYIQDMYGALNRKTVMVNGVLQVAPIKSRLHRISVKVLGEDKVKDVLLQVVQQKRT